MRILSIYVLLCGALSAQNSRPDSDVRKAVKKLDSENYLEGQEGRTELVEIGRRAVPELIVAYRDKKASIQRRHMICEILGAIRHSSPEVLAVLTDALKEEGEFGTSIASVAAHALASVADPKAAPALIAVMKERRKDETTRKEYRRVERDRHLKYECIRAMGILRAKEAVDLLLEALKDKKTTKLGPEDQWSHLIAAAAAAALGKIRAPEAIGELGKLLTDPTKDEFSDRPLKWHAARALERILGESKGSLLVEKPEPALQKWLSWYNTEHKPKANVAETRETMKKVEAAVRRYQKDVGEIPTALQYLISAPPKNKEKWKGPYLKDEKKDPAALFRDAWGRDLKINVSGTGAEFDLYSQGADGRPWGAKFNADLYNHDKYVPVVRRKNKERMDKVVAALEKFKLDQARYPDRLGDLVKKPSYTLKKKWEKPYLPVRGDLQDAFQRQFVYRVRATEGAPYDLISYGADFVEGGDGINADLWNHDKRPKKKDGK